MIEAGNRRIARNTLFLYGRLAFVLIVSLYTVRVILNALGIDDYGIYNVVAGFVAIFGFINTSMSNAIQRFYNYEIGKSGNMAANKVFNAAIRVQAILTIAIFIICEIIGLWYVNFEMEIPEGRLGVTNGLLQFSLMSLCLTVLQIPYSSAALAYEKMDFYAITGVVDVILKLIIAFIVKYIESDKLLIYGLLILLIAVINFLMYYIYTKRNFKCLKLSNKEYSQNFQREMLSFSGWSTFGSFAFAIRGQGIILLLNYFFGVVINAANGIATQISAAFQQFALNLILAFKPQLVQSYAKNDYNRTTHLFFLMTKISYALIYTLAVPLFLYINYILHLWLGTEIPEYTPSLSILSVVIVLLGVFNTPIVQLFQATGKIRNFQIITSLIICSIVPVSWIFFKLGFNPLSCYFVCIGVYLLNQIYSIWALKKQYPLSIIDYCYDVLGRSVLFSIILPVIPTLIKLKFEDTFLYLTICCITTAILSGILSLYIIFNARERSIVINSIISKLKL